MSQECNLGGLQHIGSARREVEGLQSVHGSQRMARAPSYSE